MIICNAAVCTMEGEDFKNGYVRVDNGRITDVGSMDDLLMTSEEEIWDAKGAMVCPGFVDAHCHIGMWEDGIGFEGADGNEDTDPSTPHLRGLDGVNPMDRCFEEALRAGVTTVVTGPGSSNPIGGQLFAMKTYGTSVDERIVKEPVAMKFALGENPKSCFHDKDQAPVTRMAIAAIIREQLKKAQRYEADCRKAKENGDDLPEYDMKCEALLPLLRGEIPAHFHAHRADDIYTALRLAKEFSLKCCILHGTEGWKIAADLTGCDVVVGPVIGDRSKPELREASVENAAILAASGSRVAICTDHPELPIQYLPLSAALCRKAGMTDQAALEAITIVPAQICGIDDRVGSLKRGKDADLLVFDRDPLGGLSDPVMVMAGGTIVYERSAE